MKSLCLFFFLLWTWTAIYPAWATDLPTRVSEHTAVFAHPPSRVPTGLMTDGPLLGNGDVGVVLGGPTHAQTFRIGKNDFWQIHDPQKKLSGKIIAVGSLRLDVPVLEGASYRQEQDLARAEVRGTFTKNATTLRTTCFVSADENLLVTKLEVDGPSSLACAIAQVPGEIIPPIVGQGWKSSVGLSQNPRNYRGEPLFFNGIIDDLRVYDRALSGEEVRALVNGKGPNNGLKLGWPSGPGAAEATVTGGEPVEGKVGRTIRFDGKQTRVDLPPLPQMEAVTFAAWVKAESMKSWRDFVIGRGNWGDLHLGIASPGDVILGGTYVGFVGTKDRPVKPGQWVHLAGTIDGRKFGLYVDGRQVAAKDPPLVETGIAEGDVMWFTRDANLPDLARGRQVSVATRVLGAATKAAEDGGQFFELTPDKPVYLVTAIATDRDASEHRKAVLERVARAGADDLSAVGQRHRQWWANLWDRSFVEIPDKLIERHWYGALYILASCSRAGKAAPGLWGNWITTDQPAWEGGYTLNYNFEAAYFQAYSANHMELTEPFYKALLDVAPRGREMAKARGWQGIHLPPQLGPDGLLSQGWNDHGQRCNAALAGLNFIWRYQYSQDQQWLREKGYPYLLGVADFWENYLKFEDGRYVIHNDAIQEGYGSDFNNVFSLSLVRTLFRSMLQFSQDLGVDADRRAKWQHILDHISAYPTQKAGEVKRQEIAPQFVADPANLEKTIFRYTEKGTQWCDRCALGIHNVFPVGDIGLDSDPKWLEVARNTIAAMERWGDLNHAQMFFISAARVGHDPNVILARLVEQIKKAGMPNLLLHYGGGGVQEVGIFAVVNEMLLQSHEGVLRFFPVWPRELDARFGDLRTYGAFLVSADLKDGVVSNVKIVSEKGKDCVIQNPWPGRTVVVTRNGRAADAVQGERFTLETTTGETIVLSVPATAPTSTAAERVR